MEDLEPRHTPKHRGSDSEPYGEGLADGLAVSWPPAGVPRRWHGRANAVFVSLILACIGVCAFDVTKTVLARQSPSVSYSRDPTTTAVRMPCWTVCRPLLKAEDDAGGFGGDWQGYPYATQVTCLMTAFSDDQGVPTEGGNVRHRARCPVEPIVERMVTPKGDACDVIRFEDGHEIDVDQDLRLEVTIVPTTPADTYDWVSYYVTEDMPTGGDWKTSDQAYDFGAVKLGNQYAVQITQERQERLECSWGGLKCRHVARSSYSAGTSLITQESDGLSVVFSFTSDPLGVTLLREQDPVDWLNLLSNVYSYFGYCLAAFALLFGFARTTRLRELEEAKTLHILQQHLATAHCQPALEPALEPAPAHAV
ncbi:hypothetical protein JKP88DRAFT_327978 [Tribonema minus]|uniref:Transmembrane protein n=1 Tax=Tribonema minus TaxID=303371 RepID=A0A836CBG7_9STRA|nr:hypothetical protein JKP88DRAFT_327978 [Tribonema minus]